MAVSYAAASDGEYPGFNGVENPFVFFAVAQQVNGGQPSCSRPRRWRDDEQQFIIANHHHMNDDQIGAALGRSGDAVKIYRNRHLKLPSITRLPDHPTLNQVACLMGVDVHAVCKWVRHGLIEAHDTGKGERPGQGPIQVISLAYLREWALQPERWMLFQADRIDDAMRQQVLAAQAAWGDEWWRPGQVADYWQCDKRIVNWAIHRGIIPAVRWGNWWIRRSDAHRTPRPVWVGTGKGSSSLPWPVKQDQFLVLAQALGLSYGQIAKFGTWEAPRVAHRLHTLLRGGDVPHLLREHGLDGVQWRVEQGKVLLFADWRQFGHRFPTLCRAVERFKAGTARPHHLDCVQAILRTWARWYGHELAVPLTRVWGGRVARCKRVARLEEAWMELRASGLEPL